MSISSSFRFLSLTSLAFILGACAYSQKASFQDITFLSPDAQDAKCLVYVNKVKYQVWPPQTVNIKKSEKPMLVVCSAPGNREVQVEVPPKMEQVAIWGSPVGMAWDYASKSLYSYPEVIAVDFSQEKLRPFELPKHNNPDVRQPEDYDLEEFLPGDPRLNKDKNRKPVELLQRGENDDLWNESEILEGEENIDADVETDAVVDEEGIGETEAHSEQAEVVQEGDVEGDVQEDVGKESAAEHAVEGGQESSSDSEVESSSKETTSNVEVLTPVATGEAENDASESLPSDGGAERAEADSAPVLLVPGE